MREVLSTSYEENLAMIGDSVRYLKSKGKGVLRLPLRVGRLAAVARHQARVALTIYPD